MVEPLADQIIRKIKQAVELYHRLVVIAAPGGRRQNHCIAGRAGSQRSAPGERKPRAFPPDAGTDRAPASLAVAPASS